jgi:hypothetical protein
VGVFRTRGQAPAVQAVGVLLDRGMPQALLLVGPASVGKTTLGLDIAAALLCTAADPADRPCRAGRSCRLVDSGNHPDVHRLAPEGPAGEIRIDPVRRLIRDLALRPAEGGARVALIERAHRLNDDAQNALLKLLEEPGDGVTIVLAADDEDALLPTVRSRAARLRLGPVATADIGDLLVDAVGADRPLATRIARMGEAPRGGPRPPQACRRARPGPRRTGRAGRSRGSLRKGTRRPRTRRSPGCAAGCRIAAHAGRGGGEQRGRGGPGDRTRVCLRPNGGAPPRRSSMCGATRPATCC